MSIIKVKVSQLDTATTLENFVALGIEDKPSNKSVKVPLELLRGNTAYQEWAGKNPGKTYEDWIAVLQKPAVTAAERADKISDHRDKIVDGYWHRWNEKTDEYENTGEIAKGNVMYATFDIDPATGGLQMNTDKEYTGANFSLTDKGELTVII